MTARSDDYDHRQREAGEMTMVERVAEAVAKVVVHRLNMFLDEDSYDAIARAAIAAMRIEPPRGKVLAGVEFANIFNRHIDAALAEYDAGA